MTDTEHEPEAGAAPAPEPVVEEPAPPVEANAEPADQIEATHAEVAIQTWLQDHIANGPIARDEACWAQLIAALPKLVAALTAQQGA